MTCTGMIQCKTGLWGSSALALSFCISLIIHHEEQSNCDKPSSNGKQYNHLRRAVSAHSEDRRKEVFKPRRQKTLAFFHQTEK